MLNLRIEATSVTGHRSSNLISKESKVTSIIADNHKRLLKIAFSTSNYIKSEGR